MARIIDHPVLGKLEDRKVIPFMFDGVTYEALEDETIAAALLANGIRTLRVHEESGTPRGFYCNIGHCMECRVTVNEHANIRACLTVVEQDMVIESGRQHPNIVKRMVEEQ
jgi:sarcosine oxidase, subunit alpha